MPTHVINEVTADVQIPIFKRKTILTDAQIKALPTTPIELVPAPGANKIIVVHGALLYMNENAGLYTNQGNTTCNMMLYYGEKSSQTVASILINNNWIPFFDTGSGGDEGKNAILLGALGSSQVDNLGNVIGISSNVTNWGDKPIIVGMNNDSGDLTGGNAGNTLSITVFYSIVDL